MGGKLAENCSLDQHNESAIFGPQTTGIVRSRPGAAEGSPRENGGSILPVRDRLSQRDNAAWIGLARYQLLIGKPHPVTAAVARMHADDQDVIDDFLLEVSQQGLSLRGSSCRG